MASTEGLIQPLKLNRTFQKPNLSFAEKHPLGLFEFLFRRSSHRDLFSIIDILKISVKSLNNIREVVHILVKLQAS